MSQGGKDRRNTVLGIVNGVATIVGMNVTDTHTVLSVFVRALGGSNTLVGLLSTLRFGGWFLPQFLMAGWIQPRPRKVPIVVGMEVVRATIYGLLAVLVWAGGISRPELLLLVFFILFTVTRLTAGTGSLARMDTLGKVIPARRRGAFFAMRGFWSRAFLFGAGLLVTAILDERMGLTYPLNFALLFALSSGSFWVATLTFAGVRETSGPVDQPVYSIKDQVARAPALLQQDPALSRYLLVRILLTFALLVEPFYAVFALDVLGAPDGIVGIYLAVRTLAGVLSNLVWQRMERVRDTYWVVTGSALLTALTPVLALVLPWAMGWAGLTTGRFRWLPAYLFTAVFVLVGGSQSGRAIGLMALSLDIPPEEERASYIGLVNTASGVFSILSIVSGALIDWAGFEVVFLGVAVLLTWGVLATLGLRRTVAQKRERVT